MHLKQRLNLLAWKKDTSTRDETLRFTASLCDWSGAAFVSHIRPFVSSFVRSLYADSFRFYYFRRFPISAVTSRNVSDFISESRPRCSRAFGCRYRYYGWKKKEQVTLNILKATWRRWRGPRVERNRNRGSFAASVAALRPCSLFSGKAACL